MLCSLLDGCARTATELAALADIGASSASAALRPPLRARRAWSSWPCRARHRYYQLADADVAQALEALLVVAGVPRVPFKPATPGPLCHARTCYDHMAGTVAVRLHDAMLAQRWLQPDGRDYRVTPAGAAALTSLGLDLGAIGRQRRRHAYPCLDWSARRPHLGGALGAALLPWWLQPGLALLQCCLQHGWVEQQLDSRALRVTAQGERRFDAWCRPRGRLADAA
ncbi:putative ArsR-family transcriptional regulator [Bordetella bronchiseptica MO211]|nr:putative ArsR-family transcriptional regulator [Bordetella bronchiseptica MO211]